MKGMICFKKEEFAEAIEEFTQVIELDEKFADAFLMRGKASLKLEQTIAAKEDFKMVLQIDPSNEEVETLFKD